MHGYWRIHGSKNAAFLVIQIVSLGFLVAACGQQGASTPPSQGKTGTVRGTVVTTTTCPVDIGDDRTCSKRPVSNHQVKIETSEGNVVATAVTDTQGVFTAVLPAGTYRVLITVPRPAQLGKQQQQNTLTIVASQTVTMQIVLDTGRFRQ